ncbi:hypothetical protein J6590_051170 [Homalodisca vitripennis]|nr:hypothetical protein J6590_051170 [Homalodisca vitripennis]
MYCFKNKRTRVTIILQRPSSLGGKTATTISAISGLICHSGLVPPFATPSVLTQTSPTLVRGDTTGYSDYHVSGCHKGMLPSHILYKILGIICHSGLVLPFATPSVLTQTSPTLVRGATTGYSDYHVSGCHKGMLPSHILYKILGIICHSGLVPPFATPSVLTQTSPTLVRGATTGECDARDLSSEQNNSSDVSLSPKHKCLIEHSLLNH